MSDVFKIPDGTYTASSSVQLGDGKQREERERGLVEFCDAQAKNIYDGLAQDGLEMDEVYFCGYVSSALDTAIELWNTARQASQPSHASGERTYAHMCRDEHVEIGHNDSSSELCPLCRAINERDAAGQAMAEKAAQLVAKWREEAKHTSPIWADAIGECADELEEAIRSFAGAEPPQNKEEK